MSGTYLTLLPSPELQFCDANGVPFAGGTLATYTPGTTTPKNTWADQGGTVLNANPIVLDAAGRCIVWGSGVYRTILSDAAGNLVWDQLSTTIVSQAMAPVVMAPTIAEAVRLLGIQDLIDAEATARQNADAALQTAINAKADQTALTAEINRAEAAEAALQTALNNEIARAEAAEAALQSQITTAGAAGTAGIRNGTATTDSVGRFNVTNDPAFPTRMTGLEAWQYGTAYPEWPNTDTSNMYVLNFNAADGNPLPASVNGIGGVLCQLLVDSVSGELVPVTNATISWRSHGI
jgi:hypothetical protein